MEKIILVVHMLTAIAIIGLILLQQGKGAEMGASFGAGASQTVFGSQGGGNFFTRMTAIFAAIFFATSFSLAVVAKQGSSVARDAAIPTLETSKEALDSAPESTVPAVEPDVPVVDSDNAEPSDVPAASDVQTDDIPTATEDENSESDVPQLDESPK